jgi:hypothetical protein
MTMLGCRTRAWHCCLRRASSVCSLLLIAWPSTAPAGMLHHLGVLLAQELEFVVSGLLGLPEVRAA